MKILPATNLPSKSICRRGPINWGHGKMRFHWRLQLQLFAILFIELKVFVRYASRPSRGL